jgi:hypothetical protein
VPDGKAGEEAFAVIRDAMRSRRACQNCADQPSAHHGHRAHGQGPAGHAAALRLRGAR